MLPHAGGNDLFVLYIFKCVSQDNLNVNAFRVKREYIQGDFFHWYPPKKLKYGKSSLGESTLT